MRAGDFCPRCGTERVVTYDTEPGRSLDETGGQRDISPFRDDGSDWIPLPLSHPPDFRLADVWVCENCVTVQESRLYYGQCVRCGRENGVDSAGETEDERCWYVDELVCPACSTHDERRDGDLAVILTAADAIALRRRDDDPEECLRFIKGSVDLAVQRGVPNKWHFLDPLNPLADESEPWDAISEDLQRELVICAAGVQHRELWAGSPESDRGSIEVELAHVMPQSDWALLERVERALRDYVREAQEGQRERAAGA